MSGPVVIIGAGQTAAQAVTTLRGKGFDGPIIVFGDEAHPPYQRPPLSKAFLSGETTAERLELKGTHFYEQHNVDLRLGNARCAAGPTRAYGRVVRRNVCCL